MALNEEKSYVTTAQGQLLSFNYDWFQVFHHESNLRKTPPATVTVALYRKITDANQKEALRVILEFLRDFCFASKEQLVKYLDSKNVIIKDLDSLLDQALASRMVTYFILSKYDSGEIPTGETPADAYRVYCLDFAGKDLLAHISASDYVSWLSKDNLRSVEIITKYLVTNEFYLSLLKNKKDELRYFKALQDFNIGKRFIRVSANFCIMQGHTPREYILESVRDYDLPIGFRDKMNKQLAIFIREGHWKQYYSALPVFLFVTENKKSALEVADIFFRTTGSDQFRVITDEQIRKGLDKAAFLKYVPATETKPASMVAVRSALFGAKKAATAASK